MIKEFVERWEAKKTELQAKYEQNAPGNYDDIFKDVCGLLKGEEYGSWPDIERIHVIDDGDYQGTRLFVVACTGYQPSDYWYCKISYGSCSGCDAFQGICVYSNEKPTAEQVQGYLTLALHFVQGLKKMGDE